MADFTVIKPRQQQVWAIGDDATVGNTLVLVSELLCEAVDGRAGQQVLDVATGNGNTALAAARRWCEVMGIDEVPALLRWGEARTAAEGLSVTFQEGDAEQLPCPDGAFDVVLSTFGAVCAPDQEHPGSVSFSVKRVLGYLCSTSHALRVSSGRDATWVLVERMYTGQTPP